MGGRPRKPTKTLKIQGTFEARHRDEREPQASGCPVMPDVLTGVAAEHWKQVVPELHRMGIVGVSDTVSLTAMCRTWQMACQAFDEGETRDYLEAIGKWLNFAGRFGMTPADRSKIIASPPKGDELDSLLKVV